VWLCGLGRCGGRQPGSQAARHSKYNTIQNRHRKGKKEGDSISGHSYIKTISSHIINDQPQIVYKK
jgi:hypothetical protein